MSELPQKKSDQARAFYNAAAPTLGDLSLMNYGYAGDSQSPPSDKRKTEHFCLELYRHVGQNELAGGDVLEVSCGRGGGAYFVMTTYRPATLVGVDVSDENIGVANRRFGAFEGLEFRVGKAEHLDFADGSFDAVLNVEASHLYDDPARFFAEVFRVLRPGGLFLYADLFWRDRDPQSLLADAGFVVRKSRDVTRNVLRSLELDSDRREALIEVGMTEEQRRDFRDWSGIKGYRAYNRFASGEWIYRSFQLARP